MSEETSVTDQIQLKLPKNKSTFGLKKKNKSIGKTTLNNGFTNDVCIDGYIDEIQF